MNIPQSLPSSRTTTDAGAVSRCNRLLDIFCCLLALPLLGILHLVMAVITRLFAPGPVLYRQERIGFREQRFAVLKFRTMTVAADPAIHQTHLRNLIASNAPMVKLDHLDARLIPGAWLLRASGLDELPQIINVLRGEMSIVGPRPCLPTEFEQYLPWQRERTNALPGLTGLWQVSGKNRTSFDEMIRLDIRYTRNPSLWLNLRIICQTPWALAVQIGDIVIRRKAASPAAVSNRAPISPLKSVRVSTS